MFASMDIRFSHLLENFGSTLASPAVLHFDNIDDDFSFVLPIFNITMRIRGLGQGS